MEAPLTAARPWRVRTQAPEQKGAACPRLPWNDLKRIQISAIHGACHQPLIARAGMRAGQWLAAACNSHEALIPLRPRALKALSRAAEPYTRLIRHALVCHCRWEGSGIRCITPGRGHYCWALRMCMSRGFPLGL